jgi:hypothetical protein
VEGTCECGNESSVSIKCGEFLDYLRTGELLKKDSAAWSQSVLAPTETFHMTGLKIVSRAADLRLVRCYTFSVLVNSYRRFG